MSTTVKWTLIILAVALVISGLVAILVNRQRRLAREQALRTYYELSADQQSSDRLLARLDNAKVLRDELMLPQIDATLKLY